MSLEKAYRPIDILAKPEEWPRGLRRAYLLTFPLSVPARWLFMLLYVILLVLAYGVVSSCRSASDTVKDLWR